MSGPAAKTGTPVVGFNHNVSYQGRSFHIQTEDSGPQHGHVITHLYLGGNIITSRKTSYPEPVARLEGAELSAAVRRLMEDQHKAMMKGLLAGAHDAEIQKRTGGNVYEPGVLASGERAPGLLVGGEATPRLSPPAAPALQPAPAGSLPATVRAPPVTTPRTPPVLVPKAGMVPLVGAPPVVRPSIAPPRAVTAPTVPRAALDELVLQYLLSDLDAPRS
jgi:hypothetical protein